MSIPYWLRPLVWEMEKAAEVFKMVLLAYIIVGTLALLLVGAYILLA